MTTYEEDYYTQDGEGDPMAEAAADQAYAERLLRQQQELAAAMRQQENELPSSLPTAPPPPQPSPMPDIGPGIPMRPDSGEISSMPYDPIQGYREASKAGPGPGADAAWNMLVESGQRPQQAMVYPPVAPPTMSNQWVNANQNAPDPAVGLILKARNMGVSPEEMLRIEDAQNRFSAQDRYQQRIAKGGSPQDAIMEVAPYLFGSSSRGGRGMINPFLNRQQQSERPVNIGGRGYVRDPSSPEGWRPITPPKEEKAPPINAFDMTDYRKIVANIPKLEKERDTMKAGSEEWARKSGQIEAEKKRLAKIRKGYSGSRVTPPDGLETAAVPEITAPEPFIYIGTDTTKESPNKKKGFSYIGTDRAIEPPKKSSGNFPPVPSNPGQRQKGQTYSSSKGNFTWTGTGWIKSN